VTWQLVVWLRERCRRQRERQRQTRGWAPAAGEVDAAYPVYIPGHLSFTRVRRDPREYLPTQRREHPTSKRIIAIARHIFEIKSSSNAAELLASPAFAGQTAVFMSLRGMPRSFDRQLKDGNFSFKRMNPRRCRRSGKKIVYFVWLDLLLGS